VFFEGDKLVVRQKKDWSEALMDVEAANQYELLTPGGEPVGRVVERSGGCADFLLRNALKSSRPLHLEIFDLDGPKLVEIHRPFSLWLSRMEVQRADGTKVGTVQKKLSFLRAQYELLDRSGQSIGRVTGKLLSRRTFPLLVDNAEVGRISKEFQGLSELFTDADTFVIDLGTAGYDDDQKLVALATALAVDLDLFENG